MQGPISGSNVFRVLEESRDLALCLSQVSVVEGFVNREYLLVLETGGEDFCDLLGMGSESNGRPQQVSNFRASWRDWITGAVGEVWVCF